jgi:hypothetical protein
MKSLRDIFNEHSGNLIHKLDHYFEIYERYFEKYRDRELVILEIGISHGGSFQIWKKYFGSKVKIYAVDINPDCKKLEEENVTIFIGSQEDKNFLSNLIKQIPAPDLIIDDGGHTMKQQIVTFEALYQHLKEDGVYVCEDTCTSYWYEYGGGLHRKDSFIEYSKKLIDYLYAWHSESKKFLVNDITRTTNAIHFYDSMVIFEKLRRKAPEHVFKGEKTIAHDENPMASKRTLLHKIIKKIKSA